MTHHRASHSITSVMMLSLVLVLLLATRKVQAAVTLVNSLSQTVRSDSAYSPQLASRLNFAPVTGPAYFAGDLCFKEIVESEVPQNAIVFFSRIECDETIPLNRILPFSSKVTAVVELYGTKEAVVDLSVVDADPYDTPPRFSFDPRLARQNLNYVRVHGSAAGLMARFLNSSVTVNATVEYTADPWKAMYYTPQWIIYETIVIFFFCVYIFQHAIRSIILIFVMRRRSPLHSRNTGMDLQLAMMISALFVGVVRTVEYSTQTLRDYGDIWTPEIVSQLAWGYGYMILLLSILLLVLYWADVLKTSKVKMVMIQGFSTRVFVTIAVVGFLVLTMFIVLFVYQIPGTAFAKSAGFLLLGIVALFESVGTMFFGGRLLKQLTDVKPVAERGGSFHRPLSPSVTASPDAQDVASDNPAFDPSMTKSSSLASPKSPLASPKGAKARFSLSKAISSKTSQISTSDDMEEKRKIAVAQKRAKPLTRLVFISALLLFVATIISAVATFTTILYSPNTYIVIFSMIAFCEITIYALVIQTMSPIWQVRRKRFAKAEMESSQLAPLSEEGVPVTGRRSSCARLRFCLCNWCVCTDA